MTAEFHARSTEIFLAACELEPPQRSAFVEHACGGDAQLRRAVEDLLRSDRGDGFLERPASSSPMFQKLVQQSRGTALPERIGRYRILRVLGEGGMGVVYEAEQDQPKRVVALKVIRPGWLTESTLRRFENEAQLLGKLQHVGIAQVFEAGTADSGSGPQPYLAMERIQGLPLRTYVEQQKLDVRSRLELFQRVCDAVHHAHSQGVLHRDLKPANILVDSSGQPKVLDFGIARAMDSDVRLTTQHTDLGQLLGTLPYMSPEQAGGDSQQLDARSDVYALGVVLYELLAGALPYDMHDQVLHEAVRVIREAAPVPLSSHNRFFRGDLETIVQKALEKERAHRYGSAGDFRDDIARHLSGHPIAARPPTMARRLYLAARRHRLATATAAMLIVGGALGFGFRPARERVVIEQPVAIDRWFRFDSSANKRRPISPGEPVHAGDVLGVKIDAPRPLFVWALSCSGTNASRPDYLRPLTPVHTRLSGSDLALLESIDEPPAPAAWFEGLWVLTSESPQALIDQWFAGLERLDDRSTPGIPFEIAIGKLREPEVQRGVSLDALSPAMRDRIVEALTTEVSEPGRWPLADPKCWSVTFPYAAGERGD
ncbi:MAG: serine/threonine-protein kinase [Planctomycetota bacterium]